ncbi:MAG: hypothetical protein BWY25_03288 [Chloroflexi bacterium ADurb.Bin222]|nr:MAG: hypothetical protein BWY25_03288 [Chloroflexi bacterium ADurb.Bin222]
MQGLGARTDADGVSDPAIGSELTLKGDDFWPQDKGPAREHSRDGSVHLCFEGGVLALEIEG